MGHQKSTARLLKISALVSIVMAFTTLLSGQEYTPGQPVIANSTKGTVTDGVSWDAKAFPGSDICAQIFNAWSAAMATGLTSATIDARGITGTQSCSANPFPRKASGKLWLGNTVIITTATLPDKSNTTLRAGSSAADPVLQMGNNQSVTFDVQVKSMSVDAYGLATTGILNNSALEGSTLEDVDINNATKYGLL